jgi:hypothetical protein
VLRQLRDLLPASTMVAAIHDKDLGVVGEYDAARLSLDDAVPMLARLPSEEPAVRAVHPEPSTVARNGATAGGRQ